MTFAYNDSAISTIFPFPSNVKFDFSTETEHKCRRVLKRLPIISSHSFSLKFNSIVDCDLRTVSCAAQHFIRAKINLAGFLNKLKNEPSYMDLNVPQRVQRHVKIKFLESLDLFLNLKLKPLPYLEQLALSHCLLKTTNPRFLSLSKF